MQVSGRTARNVNGMVLLYGDKITDSMQYLIDETNRRRKIQKKYNKINNINPKTIYKSLDEIRNHNNRYTQVSENYSLNYLKTSKRFSLILLINF